MIISLDTETHLIARAQAAPKPVCISWADPHPSVALVDSCRAAFEAWLRSNATLIGTNIAYDMAVLGEYWPDLLPAIFDKYERGQIEDVGLREKILNIATKGRTDPAYSLEELCAEYGLPVPDKGGPWRKDFARLEGIDPALWPAGAREYVLGDAALPLEVYAKQAALDARWQSKTGYPVLHIGPFEAYKAFVLHLIECWGVHTHPERTRKFHAGLLGLIERAGASLKAAQLVREDGSRDTKAAKARMVQVCASLELDVPKTDKGGVCLDKEACEATHDELLKQYSIYSQAVTLRARADDMMQGFELPLQTRFDSMLETGRTSTSKPKPPLVGAQMQNFPRAAGARECLMFRPGHVGLVCDLPTAELRSLAQTCIDKGWHSSMADRINAGEDLHTWFACQILGITYAEGLARMEAKDPAMKEARQQAKPCNFGFPGGMGIDNFRAFAWRTYKVRLTVERAKQLKAIWLAAFPEMARYFDWIGKMYPGDRQFALVRFLRSGRFRGRVMFCGAANGNFQELTGNGAIAGLIQVSRECYTVPESALFDSRPILYTHDEIVTETPRTCAEAGALRLAKLMQTEFNKWHPDVPIVGLKADIVEMYSKG